MGADIQSIFGTPEKEFAIATLTAIAAAAAVALYIAIVQPVTRLVFEAPSVRYKVQGYLSSLVFELVDRVYRRAFDIEVIGAEEFQVQEELAIILSNHVSLLDYFTIQNLARNAGLENSCFFYVWKYVVRMPSLRTMWNQWLKNADWYIPQQSLPHVLKPLLESPWSGRRGKWLVIFPEVTPWNAEDMLEHRIACEVNACPTLESLLYPRFSAFLEASIYLKEHGLENIYDITINYHRLSAGASEAIYSVPSFTDIVFSNHNWKIQITVSRMSAKDLPTKDRRLMRWLEKRWFAKDSGIAKARQATLVEEARGAILAQKEAARRIEEKGLLESQQRQAQAVGSSKVQVSAEKCGHPKGSVAESRNRVK